MVVVFELVANGHDVDRRSALDLVQNDVTGAAKGNDQLAPERAVADLAIDERRAPESAFDLALDGVDGVDRVLCGVEILDRLGAVEQEVEPPEQIIASRLGAANLELTGQPRTRLRRASSRC